MRAAEIKHKKFARELVKNGGNGTLAYAKVYPASTKAAAATSASELLKKPDVIEEITRFRSEMARLNGPTALAKDVKKMRRATKGIWHEGERVGEEPDHAARNAAIKTALQTVGVLNDDTKPQASAPSISINFLQVNAPTPNAPSE